MTDRGFAERSRAAFAKRFPGGAAELDRIEAPVTSVAVEDGLAVDIVVADARLYGGDARGYTDYPTLAQNAHAEP